VSELHKKIIDKLKSADWTLAQSSSRGHLSSLHPYPARFIPQIPDKIINLVGSDKKINILDPFAGCGTTLVEGLRAGHNVAGIDINGVSVLLQQVYTQQYEKIDLDSYFYTIKNIEEHIKNPFKKQVFREIPNIDHWFNNDTKEIIFNVLSYLEKCTIKDSVRNLVKFSVSRVLVKISNQQSDTQYRSVDKKLSRAQIIDILVNSFKSVGNEFQNKNIKSSGNVVINMGDSRKIASYKGIHDVDLIITSPPYPNAYEYWLYHKYRMYFLDFDPIWSRTHEIGARPHYSGNGKLDESDFKRDITEVLANIYTVTNKDAMQFWVVGDSIIKGRRINNSQLITEACKETGWRVQEIVERTMLRRKASFQGIGRQIKEDILFITR
jgi:site-specific DNA-methyltransferase (cytosine-N4-specific)